MDPKNLKNSGKPKNKLAVERRLRTDLALDQICDKISEIFPSDNVAKNSLQNHHFLIYLDVSDLIHNLKSRENPELEEIGKTSEADSIDLPNSLSSPEASLTGKNTTTIPKNANLTILGSSGKLKTENPVWEEFPNYFELKSAQLSESWFRARKNRITGSKAGCAMGFSKFTSPEKAAQEICGNEDQKSDSKPNPKLQAAAEHGIKTEPIVRDIYQMILRHMSKTKVEIIERGLCVPKWHQFIGSSVDGDILNTNGIIEIKCPLRMYRPLMSAVDGISHIWKTHYVQMQLGMVVLGKKFCDYLVYCQPAQELFIQRVLLDLKFWNTQMVPKLNNFFRVYMQPLITELPENPKSQATMNKN